MTIKERNLVKGAIRRVFSRSELRREALSRSKIPHSDPKRPRVKTWYSCATCGHKYNSNNMAVDHITPVIPLQLSLEEISWDDLINRLWCDIINLQVLCSTCHNIKTKAENAWRRKYKKEKINGKSSKTS